MRHSLAVAAVLLCSPAFAQPIFSTGTRNSGNESRDTNPAASNPNLPLPGTANPIHRAAPMVPNPMPVPKPSGIPAPGATAGPGGRESDDGGAAKSLLDIRDAVLRAPAGEQETAAGELVEDIKVFRRNGKVVLTGTVRSEADKDEAGRRAAAAAGGRVILNQLSVK